MFRLVASDGHAFHSSTEGDALQTAIQWVAQGVEHVAVAHERGERLAVWWDIERDTKVDETDPWYPAIVHRRF